MDLLLYGSKVLVRYAIHSRSGNSTYRNEVIEGVVDLIERRHRDTTSQSSREWYASFMGEAVCAKCNGARLNQEALSVRVGGINISEFTEMSISEAMKFMKELKLDEMKTKSRSLVLEA